MNRNTSGNNGQKGEYKVRRANISREEAKKRTAQRPASKSVAEGSARNIPPSRNQIGRQPQNQTHNDTPTNNIKQNYSKGAVSQSTQVSAVNGEQISTQNKKTQKKRRQKNDFIKPTDVVRIKGGYDKILLIIVIVLTLFGLIMDFSASYPYAYSSTGDSFHYVKRQAFFAIIGIGAMLFAMRWDYRWMRKVTVPIFVGVLILLIYVLVKGVASGVAQRWIQLGSFTIQPSEFAKTAIVLLLSLYIARNQDRITNYRNFWQSSIYGMFIPVAIVGTICLMIALEKHFSGTIIVFIIGMVVIFAGGARKSWFIGAGATAAAIILPAILLVPYAKERIDMWINPENYAPTGKIWQTLQGLYAVGSGGLFGVGLGNSRQKHLYVSQPQNDFVFAIISEELGFAGAILVIILFMLLVWRGFVIALKAPDTFSSLVAIGLTSKVAIQAILNIAVVTNTIPNTGISLPFFSYGGTALVVQLAEMGIILAISRYSYRRSDI